MSQEALELRPEVKSFAKLMEKTLRRNDYKGGWDEEPPGWLIKRLLGEAMELYTAYYEPNRTMFGYQYPSNKWLKGECADIANFAMMVADVLGDEPDERPWQREPRLPKKEK